MLIRALSYFSPLLISATGIVALSQPAMSAPCRASGGNTVPCGAVGTRPGKQVPGKNPGRGGPGQIVADPCAGDPACAGGNVQGPGPAPVSTADVMQRAMDSMTMPNPRLRTSPGARTFVGMKTFLWIDRAQWRRTKAEAKVDAQTVRAVAVPTAVEWNLGENTITCQGPGTPYRPKGPEDQTSGCTYTYKQSSAGQPDQKYQISATIKWSVSWTCTGVCDSPGGTLPVMASTTSAQLPVGEIQTNSQSE